MPERRDSITPFPTRHPERSMRSGYSAIFPRDGYSPIMTPGAQSSAPWSGNPAPALYALAQQLRGDPQYGRLAMTVARQTSETHVLGR